MITSLSPPNKGIADTSYVPRSPNDLPNCTIVAKTIGAASEVWLYRQAIGLKRLQPRVICWDQQNVDEYSLGDIPLVTLPYDPTPENGKGRWLRRLKNSLTGNYYGALGDERNALSSALSDQQTDIVICHFGPIALRVLPVALKMGIPIIGHFHGCDISSSLRNPWYRKSLLSSLKKFDALVVVATYQRDSLIQLGADPGKIHVIPCGAPVAASPNEVRLESRDETGTRFLFVGRFVPKKNPLATIRAFAHCLQIHPNARLEMIGDGPLLDECKTLCQELNVLNSVDLLGKQPNSVVLKHMASADVFVQHSITAENGDKEGWPVSIAEAMGVGLPVVATRHAGIMDQVDEEQTGFLVDENDWLGMGEKMALLADPQRRRDFSEASYLRAKEQFDFQLQISKQEDLLLACLEARAQCP